MIKKKYYYSLKEYIITVVPDDSTKGTTSGGGTFRRGDTTTISASALSGYEFVRWNDNDTNPTRTVTVTGDATYTAYFLVKRYNVVMSANSNAADAYVIYDGNTYQSGTTFRMLPNETCTLYTLPKYDTWNGITSSYRLPFMGFNSNHGIINNLLTLSTEYITATYTANLYDDTITQVYGSVGGNVANIQVGYPQIKSNNTTPFVDSNAKYIYKSGYTGSVKGDGYFISIEDRILDSVNVISANYLWDHAQGHHRNITATSSESATGTPDGANTKFGGWGTNSTISVSITIPLTADYEFVKWKIDRLDPEYTYSGGGEGYYPLYKDNNGYYGNDYFEKYYNTSFTLLTCSIPWTRCHAQITPILKQIYCIYYTTTDGLVTNHIDTTKFGVTFVREELVDASTNKRRLVFETSPTTIGLDAFRYASNLESIVIPSSVTSIGIDAFSNTGLVTITVPNTVVSLERSIFAADTSLTSVTLPDNITSIPNDTFNGCTNLVSITIPNLVTSIGSLAFAECGLSSITCKASTPPSLGSSCFYSVNTSIPVYVPSGSVSAYQAASGWSNFTNIQAIS